MDIGIDGRPHLITFHLMPGVRFRIDDLPEQPGERKTSLHRLFLPIGLFLLSTGVYAVWNSSHIKGPPKTELHEVILASVTNVLAEPEIPGSDRIDSIWLVTSNGTRIRYRNKFPYSTEILRLNPSFSLLLDSSNRVWAVSKDGEVLSQNYFEEYNIEAKSVGKYCGGFLAVMGAVLLVCFLFVETQSHRVAADQKQMLLPAIRTRKLVLVGGLFGYLILFGTVINPLLIKARVPPLLIPFIWVFSGGILGNWLVRYFKRNPPQ